MTIARDLSKILDANGDLNIDANTLFVDSSTNSVGIGTSSPNMPLEIYSGEPYIRLTDSVAPTGFSELRGTHLGALVFSADASNSVAGSYQAFEVDGSERMRIDSSGNALYGVTTASGFQSSSTVKGSIIYSNAYGGFATNFDGSGNNVYLNRLGSDGTIITLRKDGSTVGSVVAESGDLIVGNGDTALRYNDALNAIYPANASTGASLDNTLNLGWSSVRWSNLYMGGNIYLGGTGSANALDDYEEGTWTPTITGSTTAGSFTSTTDVSGHYTKVGRSVTVTFRFAASGGTGSGDLIIGGLPFTSMGAEFTTVLQYNSGLDLPTGTNTPCWRIAQGVTSGGVRCNNDGTGNYVAMPYSTDVNYARATLTYFSA